MHTTNSKLHLSSIITTASSLLLLTVVASHAQVMACKTFDRFSPRQPEIVRNYFDHSESIFVRECGVDHQPLYFGASKVSRDGDVCHYLEYELDPSRSAPAHLERSMVSGQTYMLITRSACPSPLLTSYAATNDISQSIFERLAHVWQDALVSSKSFDFVFSGSSNAMVLQPLRNTITQGGGSRLTIRNIVISENFGVWKNYKLDIANPDHRDRVYVITVSSWFDRIFRISGVDAALY